MSLKLNMKDIKMVSIKIYFPKDMIKLYKDKENYMKKKRDKNIKIIKYQ
jgi:hypothetical protein